MNRKNLKKYLSNCLLVDFHTLKNEPIERDQRNKTQKKSRDNNFYQCNDIRPLYFKTN